MSRPRLVAVLSAVASSIAAFVVLSRFQLMGTLAGAVIVPTIGTLVGHWSNEGLDRAGRWMRSVAKRGALPAASQRTDDDAAVTENAISGEISIGRAAARRRVRSQWLLATCAALALAVSVYSAVAPGPVQRVVVQERVVERTVTVTTAAKSPDASALTVASPTAGDTAQEATTNDETARTGATPSGTDQTGPTDPTVPAVDTTQPTGSPTGDDGSVPITVPDPAGPDPETSLPQPEETTQDSSPAGQSD